jgi:hypothetical protein
MVARGKNFLTGESRSLAQISFLQKGKKRFDAVRTAEKRPENKIFRFMTKP